MARHAIRLGAVNGHRACARSCARRVTVRSMTDRITPTRFHEADGVEDWRVVGEGACAYFRTGSFAMGAGLVKAISELAGLDDHHPDVDLRHEGVMVRLITIAQDYMGMTERDVELARQISAVARKLSLPADPSVVKTVQLTVDAHDIPKVKPFWRAVLGYQDRADTPHDPGGPHSRGPPDRFPKLDAPEPLIDIARWGPP